jgi:hypothetical protein
MNYRNPRLLQTARGKDCLLQIPGVCNGNPETVVACHANWTEYGKGGALKAHDVFHARGCSACHAELDQGNKLDYEEKKYYWQRGFERTMLALFDEGLVRVK